MSDLARLDFAALAPRRRSRARAALNLAALLGAPLLIVAGLLRLAGVLP